MEPEAIQRAIKNEGLHLEVCLAILYVSPAESGGVTALKGCPFNLTHRNTPVLVSDMPIIQGLYRLWRRWRLWANSIP